MKTKFKIGQKVYDHSFGWGVVSKVNIKEYYPFIIKFKNGPQAYTPEGSVLDGANPTLSTKEYTLDGFTQEEQVDFEVGEWVAVRDCEDHIWRVRQYSKNTFHFYRYTKKLTDFNK